MPVVSYMTDERHLSMQCVNRWSLQCTVQGLQCSGSMVMDTTSIVGCCAVSTHAHFQLQAPGLQLQPLLFGPVVADVATGQ